VEDKAKDFTGYSGRLGESHGFCWKHCRKRMPIWLILERFILTPE
jgi:hypothetical protein